MPSSPVPRSGCYPKAHRPFFLAASLYAAASVPLWVAEWAGLLPGCPSCDPVARHAHEMLLGFAGAVLGGYLFTKVTWPRLLLALAAWAAARIGAWSGIGGVPGLILALSYPALLFAFGGWPFLKAAKLGHNMVFAPTIAAMAVAEALYQAGRLGLIEAGERRGALTALDMVALMILVMGGRVIPAAMAGLVRKEESRELFDRNRPWLEWVVVAGMALAALVDALALPHLPAMLVAGLAALARQARWRPRLAMTDASMGPIQLGYFLLAAGLIAASASDLAGMGPGTDALHLATIGGIGLVTSAMMLRINHIRERRGGGWPKMGIPIAIVLVIAADLRVTASFGPDILIPASAALWSLAFLATAAVLMTSWANRPRA
ncbi:NnrS family protein [Paramagnetospirillum kuznetsovii]|uniref:NnrS family protein n=1 Tax=Paramagnetospirillum kuznetsovii TaxID=2053833 RepID=A0A364NWP6_9PROT|nr:NnrS family protein [Paramagnetospirillum kuznetsovii]RAU21337.1 NnrS family protein [Paramagnetospirillum kuznetsovii]